MEYKVVVANLSYKLESEINRLAQEGWEVQSSAYSGRFFVIMQRST